MSNQKIIPFGKYRDKPIDILKEDTSYTEWLLAQSWFKEKYPEINTIIINNFNINTDNTPEHNTMQIKFLKEEYRLKLAYLLKKEKLFTYNKKHFKNYLLKIISSLNLSTEESKLNIINEILKLKGTSLLRLSNPNFEKDGLDVIYHIVYGYDTNSGISDYDPQELKTFIKMIWDANISMTFRIELKPEVGDDFPAVLRQMKSLRANILIMKKYTGIGASYEELVEFFNLENIKVILEKEIDITSIPQFDEVLDFDTEVAQQITNM